MKSAELTLNEINSTLIVCRLGTGETFVDRTENVGMGLMAEECILSTQNSNSILN